MTPKKPTKSTATRGSHKVTTLVYKAEPKTKSTSRGKLEIKTTRRGNVTTVEYLSPVAKKKAKKAAAPKAKKACGAKKKTVNAPAAAPTAASSAKRTARRLNATRYKEIKRTGAFVRLKNKAEDSLCSRYNLAEIENWKLNNKGFYGLKPVPYRKKKVDIYAFCGKDENRPTMTGVYHNGEKKRAEATDAHILIASTQFYDPKKKNKIIAKFGGEIEGRYPNIDSVIPNSPQCTFDVQRLADALQALKDKDDARHKLETQEQQAKELYRKVTVKRKKMRVYVRFDNKNLGLYDFDYLNRAVNAALNVGITTGEHYLAKAVTMKNKNSVILLMPLLKAKEMTTNEGGDYLYYLVEL